MPLHVVSASPEPTESPLFFGPTSQSLLITTSQMFHKERIWNLAARSLPAEIDAIAFLDCDYCDCRPDIVQATADALGKWPIVQMFKTIRWEDQHGRIVKYAKNGWKNPFGVAAHNVINHPSGCIEVDPLHQHMGFAWAMRREMFDKLGGWYDRYPAGTNDAFSAIGFYGDSRNQYLHDTYDKPVRDHVLDWARRAFEIVRGDVGYVDDSPVHLYHGMLHDRGYIRRHEALRKAGFDPVRHVVVGANGLYEFSAECPAEIPEFMRSYLGDGRVE